VWQHIVLMHVVPGAGRQMNWFMIETCKSFLSVLMCVLE
jgi:hypothetical protein